MTAETFNLTRAEIASLRHDCRIERGHVRIVRQRGFVDRYDALLNMAEAHLDEPARLAAARQEGIADGREGVLREIREAGVRLSEASMDEAATALAARVAPMISEARAAGYREGIEAAAKWHERKADMIDVACAGGRAIDAARHRYDAVDIRTLAPVPAEADDPGVPDEDGPRDEAGLPMFMKASPAKTSAPVAEGFWGRTAARQSQRIAALKAENAALRRELEPLAREAERYDPPAGDSSEDLLEAWDSRFTIGHLRRARALLQGQGGADA